MSDEPPDTEDIFHLNYKKLLDTTSISNASVLKSVWKTVCDSYPRIGVLVDVLHSLDDQYNHSRTAFLCGKTGCGKSILGSIAAKLQDRPVITISLSYISNFNNFLPSLIHSCLHFPDFYAGIQNLSVTESLALITKRIAVANLFVVIEDSQFVTPQMASLMPLLDYNQPSSSYRLFITSDLSKSSYEIPYYTIDEMDELLNQESHVDFKRDANKVISITGRCPRYVATVFSDSNRGLSEFKQAMILFIKNLISSISKDGKDVVKLLESGYFDAVGLLDDGSSCSYLVETTLYQSVCGLCAPGKWIDSPKIPKFMKRFYLGALFTQKLLSRKSPLKLYDIGFNESIIETFEEPIQSKIMPKLSKLEDYCAKFYSENRHGTIIFTPRVQQQWSALIVTRHSVFIVLPNAEGEFASLAISSLEKDYYGPVCVSAFGDILRHNYIDRVGFKRFFRRDPKEISREIYCVHLVKNKDSVVYYEEELEDYNEITKPLVINSVLSWEDYNKS